MHQFVASLLMVCAISTNAFAKAPKQKRLLQDLIDPVLSVDAVPTSYYHPSAFQQQVYSAKPLAAPAATYLPKSSLGNIYKNHYFEYSNYGSPFQFISGNNLGLHDEETYVADGRILKQYSVMEHHPEEVERNRLLQLSHHQQTPAFTSSNFDSLFDPLTLVYPSTIGINPRFGIPLKERSPLLTTNHGPIALGSGSLGYIIGPNGVSIGSGSLGYISHQQHRDTLIDILSRRNRKLSPGPLHFGQSHN